MILLALLLAISSDRLLMVDETLRVRPGAYTTLGLSLQQRPAVVDLSFRTETASPGLSVALLGPAESRVANGPRRQFLRAVYDQRDGAFRFPARRLGDYEILLDNRANKEQEAVVILKVTLGFNEPGTLRPEMLSPERRLAVVSLSLLFFATVVLWSGRKLLAAMEKRRRDEQLSLF
jgi:hypothetical protein